MSDRIGSHVAMRDPRDLSSDGRVVTSVTGVIDEVMHGVNGAFNFYVFTGFIVYFDSEAETYGSTTARMALPASGLVWIGENHEQRRNAD